jgi:hypothetical protein
MLQMARHGWEKPFLSLLGLALLIFGARTVEEEKWWWPALLGAWIIWIVGGLTRMVEYGAANFRAAGDIPYSITYESGSVLTWLRMIWRTDPLLAALGIAGIAVVLVNWRKWPRALVWACGVAILFFTLPVGGSHLLNLRFTSAAIAPMCLLAAAVFTRISASRSFLLAASVALGFMAMAIPFHVHLYRMIFEGPGLEDLPRA